ncbi:HIT domain-containing protein [candidate division KSB1 bacterium]|nr:HIT domain-containing protein [candidate division KSB1 bacterium]
MACLFCQIAEKKIPSDIMYEDESMLAFRDIDPQAPTHFLVIPKEHIETLNDLTPEKSSLIGDMVNRARELAGEEGISESGYRMVMNCNRDGGQAVFHIHLHLLGGRSLGWPPG